MTTPPQAVAELSHLYVEYCPIVDALVNVAPEDIEEFIAEETRLGKRIWAMGYVAFGPVSNFILSGRCLSEAHRIVLIAATVRSKRLGEYPWMDKELVAHGRPRPAGSPHRVDTPPGLAAWSLGHG